MNQLDIFSAIPKTAQELQQQVWAAHAHRRALADRAAQSRRELEDKWGGAWVARFVDGRSWVAPGTWVYLPGGASLVVARIEAQPGLADRAKLTCIPAKSSIDSPLLLSDLTDEFVTRHKPQEFMPVVLFSERQCALNAGKQVETTGKAKAKPWTEQEIRALIQNYFNQEFLGEAHQLIIMAQTYREDTIDRKTINAYAEELQMKLMVSGRSFDPDDFSYVFFQVLDEIAQLPTMSTQLVFSR